MSLRLIRKTLLVAALAGLAACPGDDAESVDAGAPLDVATADAAPLTPVRQLDVLLVIDDSTTMAGEQERLASNMPDLLFGLREFLPADVSLHVGVISTAVTIDVPIESANCGQTATSDGVLIGGDGTCLTDGRFLHDGPAASGEGRETNAAGGDVAGAMACLTQLGTAGCGFEQPLEAMRKALSDEPDNAGFLRPDAALLVVLISDEDDCSASDQRIFDPAGASLTSELGPLTSFRCTEFGVTCAEGGVKREEGTYTGCEPAASSPFLQHPGAYRDFLVALKGDARRVAFVSITGDASPFQVGMTTGPEGDQADLLFSCSDGPNPSVDTAAVPAVRLRWLTDQFASRASISICRNSYDLGIGGVLAAEAMGLPPRD